VKTKNFKAFKKLTSKKEIYFFGWIRFYLDSLLGFANLLKNNLIPKVLSLRSLMASIE